MTEEKIHVHDSPIKESQRFQLTIPDIDGRITVIRTKITRDTSQMGCTDGLPDDHKDVRIDYEVFKEVDVKTYQTATNIVEQFIDETDDGK